MNTEQTQLTKKERRELKQQNKEVERTRKLRAIKTKKYLTRVFIALVILAAGFGLWKLSQQPVTPSLTESEILQVQEDDYKKGNADANVILVEYLDFECEACGAYYPLVKRLSEEYKDDVLFVSRYFPLPGHRNGMTSALAVEASGKQGKYWEMHDILFEQQRNWGEQSSPNPAIFERYAEQLDLNMEQFKQDVNSQAVKDRVVKDKNFANQLGVNSTPTFFLNGEKIQNPRGYEAFKSLIDKALTQ
jgi:protein-disulfide isomerase